MPEPLDECLVMGYFPDSPIVGCVSDDHSARTLGRVVTRQGY